MALEQVGVLVWNGTEWEWPSFYMDSVNDPSAFYTERRADTPPLPVPSDRYILISANQYQHQRVTWRWDVGTNQYVEHWNIISIIARPTDHDLVQYVLNGTDIDSSTTTYVWSEPQWIVDNVVTHAPDSRPSNHGDLYWVDDNGIGTEKAINWIAFIDNTVPIGQWRIDDLVTGRESFDINTVISLVLLNPNNDEVTIRSLGTSSTFSVSTGWTQSSLVEYRDRPSDHAKFVKWQLSDTDENLAVVINSYREARLDPYPPEWLYSESRSGGQENRLGMTPPQGAIVEGNLIEYFLDTTSGWTTVNDPTWVTHNNQIVTHQGAIVTHT